MHEMSIAQSLIDVVREEMRKCGSNILKSVYLRIGEMSSVVPDSLSFCFGIMTESTDLHGAKLFMDIIPLTGSCGDCQREFEIENYAFECPFCKGNRISIISGKELDIVEIEVG